MANYITTTLKSIRRTIFEPSFHKVIQGGTSAGKTFAIMQLLIGYAMSYADRKITVTGKSIPHLQGGAMEDMFTILKNAGIFDPLAWNTMRKTYTFQNDSKIQFITVDKMDAHGPRRDVLFVNEANSMTYDVYDQLAVRTNHFAIIDFNPSSEFWAHTELVKKQADRTSFIIVTYKDNEALNPIVRANIEAHAPKPGEEPSNWWRVYGMGLIGSLEGNIYQGWTPIDKEPDFFKKAKLVRYGLDFGFANDETALVAVYRDEDDKIGLKELIYEKKLLGSQYPARLKAAGVDPSVLIVADGARPEIIAEIKQAGFLCTSADKSAGSILRGIDRVQQHQVVYDGKNIEKEYLTYAWRKTRTGETLDVPVDGFDHCLPYDQKVKTAGGAIEIGKLVGTTGWIWSEGGRLCKYANVRKTGREMVYRFDLDDGTSFKCSGEHPIYTINRGPVPARLLNTSDLIRLDTYGSKENQRNKATIQRPQLLARQIIRVLSKRRSQAPLATQSRLAISQRADTEGTSGGSYRPQPRPQQHRKPQASHAGGEQPQRFAGNYRKQARQCAKKSAKHESMAQIGSGESMALGAWQEMLRKEKADRAKMCTMRERFLYHTILRPGSLLLQQLQDASAPAPASRATRKYAKMRKRQALRIEDVYCMDVMATSTFALDNGVIVSNCMDALRYAIDDLSRPRFDF